MPDPIRQLTLAQFAQLLHAAALSRNINEVHVHHTWRPRRRDFRGAATVEAMRRYHVETNGWSDIAQHLTIDPFGGLWTGRNWNQPPASASGHNGTLQAGPFMFEMVGDFDRGCDPFDGPQRDAAVVVVAQLLRKFALPLSAIKFHRDLGSPKTCPGTGIERAAFVARVKKALENVSAPRAVKAARSPFRAEHLAGYAVTRPWSGRWEEPDAGVVEDETTGRALEQLALEAKMTRQTAAVRGVADAVPLPRRRCDDRGEWDALRPHVVNLSRGELSEGGLFCTRPDDLALIVEAIRSHATAVDTPHVLLYAHGGLVPERNALDYARTVRSWWLGHGVYPVFFVWESGLLETLRQYVAGPRDLWDFTTDPAIELAAKGPGSVAWGAMKESARRASARDVGDGAPGGALQFALLLADAVRSLEDKRVAIHAAGHSAGSIFHAHLLPLLVAQGLEITTASFLAPAVRVDLFLDRLFPLVTSGAIGKLSMFTMEEDAERQDDCWKIYRKSLLYLVSRAFEGVARKPILGLHESARKNAALAELFGIDRDGALVPGVKAKAELQLSHAPGRDPNPLTRALAHGDFDNDPHTMSAVLRRILKVGDDILYGLDDFPFRLEPRAIESPPLAPSRAMVAVGPWSRSGTSPAPAAAGRRVAVCVGIDAYRDRPLAGCKADARTWGRSFESLGFEVRYLFDDQATRRAIIDAVQSMIVGARPGDVLAFQYSGHGTQMPDLDGDEADRFDEAFVPIDYTTGAFLLDDDVAAVLGRLPQGVLITLFMDCCHSGTNSRFAPPMRPRVTSDERVRYLPATEELTEAHLAFRKGLRAAPAAAPESSLAGVVHFAACQDDEYAWESAGQGDFTGAATRLLAQAVQRGDTNEAFLQSVRQEVVARGRQHPAMMDPPPGLRGRGLLAPFVAGAGAVVPASGSPPRAGGTDAELLSHLEAVVAILRARTGRVS